MAMLDRILSHDRPRSRWLALALIVVFVALAVAPFVFPGAKALSVAAKALVFILLVASFDLLLGYTGIVSFAHTMFFGIGAYGVAIASTRMGPGYGAVIAGTLLALAVSLVLSLVIGLFSLRVKAIFYAMITLAVASAFQTLASQLSDFTGGEDGLTFKNPEPLQPVVRALREPHPRPRRRRQGLHLLPAVRGGAAAVPGAAAHRQLALRARAAGHPRERLPRRGDRLPHRGLPHLEQRAVGDVRHAGRRAAGAVAALRRARTPRCRSRSCSTSCSSSSSAAWARCTAR
jgi:hypothetical protein